MKSKIGNHSIILLILLFGLYLFKEGFLLSRLEMPNHSPPVSAIPQYEKTLLIMIDALRYDFMKWQDDIPIDKIPHFINKLPVLEKMLKNQPRNSLLLRGLSDPPTTTLQRLMAMMTGALPTLVDAGSNFASSALQEDNLIEKILEKNKRIVAIGDDTWQKLFPLSINESYFYPSFEVWDLHTVDLGVLEHLMPMLDRKEHNWGFLIAHFLGVDHAGHRYGPGHVEMGEKLIQMNTVLEQVFEKVLDDTLVIVMGDHGMDKKGDHGGDSAQEMNAGLFFYSKKPFISSSLSYKSNLNKVLEGIQAIDPDYSIFSKLDGDRTVPQIDMVPTIASLMGLAIPFGNLGTVIPEFFINNDYAALINATAANSKQVYEYLRVYGEKRSDAKAAFQKSMNLYIAAVEMEKNTPEEQLEIYLAYTKFLRHTLLVARSIWSRFEPTLMAMGTIILSMGVVLAFLLQSRQLELNLRNFVVSSLLGSLFGFFTPIRYLVYPAQASDTITLQAHHEILFFALGLNILAMMVDFWSKPQIQVYSDATLSVASVLTFLYVCTVGSDSFLIFEDAVLLHFIQYLHFYLFFFYTFKTATDKTGLWEKQLRLFAAAIIVRVISLVTICRPDQGPYCIPSYNDSPTSSISALWTLMPLSFLTLSSIVFIKSKILKILIPYTICTVSSLIYWILQTLVNHQVIADKFIILQNGFVYMYWISLFYAFTFHFNRETSLQIGLMFLILFQKPMGGIILYLFYIYIHLVHPFPAFKTLSFFTSLLVFFATGHQNSLPTIQYDIGFVGLTEMNMILSPLFIAFNTFGGMLLIAFEEIDLAVWLRQVTVVVGFTWHFARHSQAFRVWGPKFLIFSVGSVFVLVISLLVMIRKSIVQKTDKTQ